MHRVKKEAESRGGEWGRVINKVESKTRLLFLTHTHTHTHKNPKQKYPKNNFGLKGSCQYCQIIMSSRVIRTDIWIFYLES